MYNITKNTLDVYRVEDAVNKRIMINNQGDVEITDKKRTLFLVFDNKDRAVQVFRRLKNRGLPDIRLKTFQVTHDFFNEVKKETNSAKNMQNEIAVFSNNDDNIVEFMIQPDDNEASLDVWLPDLETHMSNNPYDFVKNAQTEEWCWSRGDSRVFISPEDFGFLVSFENVAETTRNLLLEYILIGIKKLCSALIKTTRI